MLNIPKIRAISFDLDDTLRPIWLVIERAEKELLDGLNLHAPMTAALVALAQAVWLHRQGKLWPHPGQEPTLEIARLDELTVKLCVSFSTAWLSHPPHASNSTKQS